MQIKNVIGTKLLVKKAKEDEELKKTEGGIIITQLDNANHPRKGEVEEIGLEVKDYLERYKGKPIKKGDTILYDNTDYQTIMDGNTPLEIIDLSNLIVVL